MPFDDDDNPALATPRGGADSLDGDGDGEGDDRAPDFRLFSSMLARGKRKNYSSQSIRKGEKDFESHGTRVQEQTLESSRQVMEEVLSYQRTFREGNWIRAWYYPDYWATRLGTALPDALAGRPTEDLFLRDRVVVVEHARGFPATSYGRVIPGLKKYHPAHDKTWLLPEEALHLLERGTLDIWWPSRDLEEILPGAPEDGDAGAQHPLPAPATLGDGDIYDAGVPLSLQAAYSLLIGVEGQRGKVSLAKYQVYAHLKRSGYQVFRATESSYTPEPTPPVASTPHTPSAWQWLFSLLTRQQTQAPPPFGPLVRPGLYRSYKPIWRQLSLIPAHESLPGNGAVAAPNGGFRVFYFVWKSGGAVFSKTRPPPPDFRIAVVDGRESSLPTLDELTALLDSTPYSPPDPTWNRPGQVHKRLKHGHRNVIIGVVDRGIVSFTRFSTAAFGEELVSDNFDSWRQGLGHTRKGGRSQRRR